MRILLTGATGFLGARVADLLNSSGHQVFATCRQPSTEDVATNWISQDLTQPLDATKFPDRVETVVHLAQSTRYREFPEGAQDVYEVNVNATFELLEWARAAGVKHFVFASTGGVYSSSTEPLSEQSLMAPSDFYSRSKYAGELLVDGFRDELRVATLRPFFIYGAGQRGRLIPNLVESIQEERAVKLVGEGGLVINPIHVSDAARAVEQIVATEYSGTLNLAGDETVSMEDLGRTLGELLGCEPLFERSEQDALPQVLVGDNSAMRTGLDLVPEIRLADGLKEMVVAANFSGETDA